VRILAELLAGESGDTRSVMFRPRLITRESTAPPGSK
jgi:DNA-binding LacI/PurR family transcriptional regulator